jgi:hypothetical protein
LTTYLRKHFDDPSLGTKLISKIKAEDSRKNHLLQLADMICGAVARCRSGRPDANEYRKVISHREFRVEFWPK